MHRSYSQAGGRNIPLSAGGAERVGVRWGISAFRTAAPPTSPSRRCRAGSLPLPPQAGGEGHDPRERSVPAEMCACTSASAGVTIASFPTDQPGPFLEGDEQIADEPARDIIGQAAFIIELGLRLADK